MKLKMSISIDEAKIKIIEDYVKDGVFRNKSHALEQALDSFLKDLKETKNEQ
mgnify:CR=1 FL=1